MNFLQERKIDMRLIDVDEVEVNIRNSYYIKNSWKLNVLSAIKLCKVVDAVEIVRCKDCVHKGSSVMPVDKIYCKRLRCYTEENDFCSYGERKETTQ